jgi:hypothetical protein
MEASKNLIKLENINSYLFSWENDNPGKQWSISSSVKSCNFKKDSTYKNG